jgi:hypothetical protein
VAGPKSAKSEKAAKGRKDPKDDKSPKAAADAKAADPLGKRALYWVPPATPGTGEDGTVTGPDVLPLGKRALYSGAPAAADSDATVSDNPLVDRGMVTVRCQRCRHVSRVGLLDLLIFQLPVGVWLPRGKFDRRMTCPSCRRRAWCSVTLRRN